MSDSDSDDEGFSLFKESESSSEDTRDGEECSESDHVQLDDQEEDIVKLDDGDSDGSQESDKQSDEDDIVLLSLEDKVKHLQENFKSVPPLMIKKVLQRDDVKGDLQAASSCLKAMSSSTKGTPNIGLGPVGFGVSNINKGKKQKPPVLPKKKQQIKKDYEKNDNRVEDGKENESTSLMEERKKMEETAVGRSTSEFKGHNPFGSEKDELFFEEIEMDDSEDLSLEEKVKILQETFQVFPPFVIRKVLGRQDVKEDLQKAKKCLEGMSPLRGTFKDGEGAPKDQRNQGRGKAWKEKKEYGNPSGKTDEERNQHGQEGAVGGRIGNEGNTENHPQKKKRTNRGKNRKKNSPAQTQGWNEGNNPKNVETPGPENFSREGWQGGYQHQPYWVPQGHPQQQWRWGGFQPQPWMGRGGFNRGRGRNYGGKNQRGFPKGGGRDHQRGYAGNYYYGDTNFGPHQWPECEWEQREWHSEQSVPPSQHGGFQRSQSAANIRYDGFEQRMDRGQHRLKENDNPNANAQNRPGRDGNRWVGRGAKRGAGQRQTPQPQNVPIQNEIQNFEPNMILIRGLTTSTTFDAIRNFVEARSGEEVQDIAKLNSGQNALVTLEKLSDFGNAKEKMESRPLDGANLTIHRVPVSSSILVHNISPDTTRDALEFYFSNQRIGGEVIDIQFKKGESQAVVKFKDPNVMLKVLSSNSLKLNDAKLTVERFNPTLQETSQGLHIKDETPVPVDKDIMGLISSTNCLKELKESLSVLGFNMKYSSGDSFLYIAPDTGKENSTSKEKGIKAVTAFTGKFKAIEFDVEKDHWEAVMEEITKLHIEIGKDKLSVKESTSSKNNVTIICSRSESKELKRMFSEKVAETQNLEVKKTYSKQRIDIEEEKFALLNKIGFKEKHLDKYDELEVDIDQDNCTITITGPKKQFSEAKIVIYQELSKMSERKISLSQTVFEMLGTEEGLHRIKTELRSKQLDAVFCIDEDNEEDNTASVVGINKKHADEAADLIKSITTEIKIKVDRDLMEVLRTQKWRDLCDEVKREFKVYVRINEYCDTWIAGFKEDVSKANDRIQKFLDDNSIGTETFDCLSKGVRRYIMEHRKKEITSMETALEPYSVKIKAGESPDSFSISGTKLGIARLQTALHLLTGSVAMNEMKVQQPGLIKFFTSGREDRLVKSVEHEHQCAIEKVENAAQSAQSAQIQSARVSDESLETSSSSESDEEENVTAQPHSNMSVAQGPMSMMCGNVNISWKQGNIEAENARVLVGSCIGQLSKVFERAGVSNIRQLRGNVSVVSQCGNLPCNHVIVTECCKWDGGNGAAKRELRLIVQKCLHQALQLGATSIAFPILGTGGLGFPHNTACQIMISEVINITSGWGVSSLKDIRFVVFGQDAQLVNAFQQEFAASSQTSAPAAVGSSIFSRLAQVTRFSRRSVPTAGTTNVSGNVAVQVLHGDLIQEQTDAIVNINGTDMNMQNAGALSKAVAAAAGPTVQAECTNLGQQLAGSAVVTGAGTLKAKNIIHMIPGKADRQHIQSCIEECLRVADSNMFQSISMPAFGTGSYSMSDADSAQATFQALANECPNLQNLRQVRIVVFQSQMVSTFHQTLQQYLTGSFKRSKIYKPPTAKKIAKPSTTSKKSGDVDGGTKAIQFRLFGKSQACVDRAQTALTKGFTEACKTQTVENEEVSKLSERQRTKLKTKARQLDVTIKFEDRAQRIVVRGDPEDVSAIINHIWEEIQERSKKERDKEQAELLYKTIKWQYVLHGRMKYFNKTSNAVIERAHATNDTRVTVEVKGEKYMIKFADSTGTALSTGQTISVTRTTVGSGAGGGIPFPKEWSPMPVDMSGKEETVHLFNLVNGSPEYQKVSSLFQITGGRGQIIKIERIQNPHLYQQYVVRKQKMDKDNRGMNNERQLFHGTAAKNLDDINRTGFNRSYCGANGTAFGNGVYFARDASYSSGYAKPSGYSNHKHMYLARVLTGESTQGHQGLIVPPKNPNKTDNTLFDSVTGYGGSVFVVFFDAQCYPEYLITFQ